MTLKCKLVIISNHISFYFARWCWSSFSCIVSLTFVLFRGGKERLVRREIRVRLELLDQPASAGLPETMVPRVTSYVSSTDTRSDAQSPHDWCDFTDRTILLFFSQRSVRNKRISDFYFDPSAGSCWLPRRPWSPWRAWHSCKWFTPQWIRWLSHRLFCVWSLNVDPWFWFVQGIDGLPGDKGDDGEAGQPVSFLFYDVRNAQTESTHPPTHTHTPTHTLIKPQ